MPMGMGSACNEVLVGDIRDEVRRDAAELPPLRHFLLSPSKGPVTLSTRPPSTVVAVPIAAYVFILPGLGGLRLVERWAVGDKVDRATVLEATYTYARRTVG
jgi:hypothetical protein